MITVGELLLLLAWIIVVVFFIYFTAVMMSEDTDKQTTTKPISGREYVSKYGRCPMCTDCPDGCPLDK